MPGGGSGGELPFVGADRIALVDELLRRFDEVASTRTPQWISLEAGSGWGKSRIAHELYRRLALERQDDGAFWPASILEAVRDIDGVALTPDGRRKRIYPEVLVSAPDSTPAWFWWGIGCDQRYGTPLQALATDISQFESVKPGLEARWREKASSWERVRRGITGARAREAVATGAGEGLSAGLAAANVAVPGLGFLVLAAKWSVQSIRNRLSDEPEAAVDVAGAFGADLVDDAAPGIAQVAREVVPVVIFVEDFHRSDETLVDLLGRVLASDDTRVLVITTAWPGVVEETDRASHQLYGRVPPERRTRYTTASGDGVALSEFDPADVRALATGLLRDAPSELLDALAERYSNPLALQLACESAKLRDAIASGGDAVRVVRGLPREVRRLYEDAWEELPDAVRLTCVMAALSSPAGVSPASGERDHRWDAELVSAGIDAMPWLREEADALDDSTAGAENSYAWVRTVTDWLRRFHEPLQFDIAHREALDRFDEPAEELAPFYEAVVARTEFDADPERALHQARLVVALEAEGFIAASDTWQDAIYVLCRWLGSQPDTASARQVVDLAARAMKPDSTSEEHLTLRGLAAAALGRLGRLDEAIDALSRLAADRARIHGADARDALAARGNLVWWLGDAGRVGEAIDACKQLLEDLLRVSPESPDVPVVRNILAYRLGQAGRVDEAIDACTELLAEQIRLGGADTADALVTRGNLAGWLGAAGRVAEAIDTFEELLDDLVRVDGPDAPGTLTVRNNLALWLGEVGRVEEAVNAYTELVADRARVLGTDAPGTLVTRSNLAFWIGKAGRLAEAIDACREVLADQVRVVGADGPDAFATRKVLAYLLGNSGRLDEAIAEFAALVADESRVLGADAPATFTSRGNLARWLTEAGRIEEAIGEFGRLLADQSRVLGPDDPGILGIRFGLVTCLASLGLVDEAIVAGEAVLADEIRVLGADSPLTLTTRNNLAYLLGEAGRVDEAIGAFRELLDDMVRVLGPDAPDTVVTRSSLDFWVAQHGGGR